MGMVTEVRCSGLQRVMACLGFLAFENLEIAEEGQPAKEGTACGELLSHMIRQNTTTPNVPTRFATNGVMWDNDMWFYAKDMFDNLTAVAKGNTIRTEERIDWMTPSGIKIRGSFDASCKVGPTLFIDDLKYGYGLVEVFENYQLLGYGIGEYIRLHNAGLAGDITQITMTIHQPRPYHPDGRVRSWTITVPELMGYYQKICDRMQEYVNGNKTLATNKKCKYCEANTNCPAMAASMGKVLETVMTDWKQDTMSNADVARELAVMERAKEMVKLRFDSLEQLAIIRMKNNQVVPGYAYEPSYGDRKWKEDVTIQAVEALTGKNIAKPNEMLSPNQAEKIGLNKKITAALTYKPVTGSKVVRKDLVAEAKKIFTKPEEVKK